MSNKLFWCYTKLHKKNIIALPKAQFFLRSDDNFVCQNLTCAIVLWSNITLIYRMMMGIMWFVFLHVFFSRFCISKYLKIRNMVFEYEKCIIHYRVNRLAWKVEVILIGMKVLTSVCSYQYDWNWIEVGISETLSLKQ